MQILQIGKNVAQARRDLGLNRPVRHMLAINHQGSARLRSLRAQRLESEGLDLDVLDELVVQMLCALGLDEYLENVQLGGALFHEHDMHVAVVECALTAGDEVRTDERQIDDQEENKVVFDGQPAARHWFV